jgi:N-acylneuraminate cytidylyltransferase
MSNVAFIPVRGGSKSIPLKNIRELSGKPLVYWTIKAACECRNIDRVYVSTDSSTIRETVESFMFDKVSVIERGEDTATDTASTESAMLEFARNYKFDNIVLIQATSPLLVAEDIDRGFNIFESDGTDSVLSAVRQKRFHWNVDKDGSAEPINYDIYQRPRRQDFCGYLVENGAFYITSKNNLIKSGNRISGNIKIVEMPEETYYEIDEPSDWVIIEKLMEIRQKKSIKNILPEIKLFLTDCDGCLTDGGMYYSERGDELKKFNTRDSLGFTMLKKMGIIVGIITGESVELNKRRAEKLKLDIMEVGCKDKVATVKNICDKYNFNMENVAYIGDDCNDLELIKTVGYSCCPADAVSVIKKNVKYIAEAKGGHGVVREVAETIILEIQEKNMNSERGLGKV